MNNECSQTLTQAPKTGVLNRFSKGMAHARAKQDSHPPGASIFLMVGRTSLTITARFADEVEQSVRCVSKRTILAAQSRGNNGFAVGREACLRAPPWAARVRRRTPLTICTSLFAQILGTHRQSALCHTATIKATMRAHGLSSWDGDNDGGQSRMHSQQPKTTFRVQKECNTSRNQPG